MSQAQALKDQGNKAFTNKNYSEAIAYYTKAIQLEQNPVFYSNRSTCYLELDQFDRAMSDARKTLELDSGFSKGYYKVGKVFKKLGDFDQAIEMFYKGLNIQ
jgi:import receptor subunit TOM70